MRTYWQLLLCLVLIFSLIGCEQPPEPVTEPVTETTEATEPTTEVTEPVWTGYVSPKETYNYYYSEGRELQWEEDLIYFADKFLTNDLHLRNRQFIVELPHSQTDAANFYNAQLHQEFLTVINDLIPQIPDLTDNQILYRLQALVSQFQDAHTNLWIDDDRAYPILFLPFYEEGEPVFYTVMISRKHEDLLYTRLCAINGIPVEELTERIGSIAFYENEHALISQMGCSSMGYLTYAFALEAAGISELGDTAATYTLMDAQGATYDIKLNPGRLSTMILSGTSLHEVYSVPFTDYDSEIYWYTTELAESTLYVRLNAFALEEEDTYADFARQLTLVGNSTEYFEKIIVDLRFNGGGIQAEGWIAIINALSRMECGAFYVLYNRDSYSCSMLFGSELEYLKPDVIFAGTPAGQSPGFFYGGHSEPMPNSGTLFRYTTHYAQSFPANEENAVIPDLWIEPTIEDYILCRDTVLEYVLAQ